MVRGAAYHILAVTDRDVHDAYDFTGPVLGKGSFATVLRVRDSMSGSEYAIKQVPGILVAASFFSVSKGIPSLRCHLVLVDGQQEVVKTPQKREDDDSCLRSSYV